MPKFTSILLLDSVLFVVSIGAMSAAALTTIPPLEVVLFCKDLVALFRQVKIAFLNGNSLVHRGVFWGFTSV